MDTELSKLIENGATVVTPTERLSRHISFLFSQEKINQRKSWITPHCLSWDSWCRIIFYKLLFCLKASDTVMATDIPTLSDLAFFFKGIFNFS